MARQDPERMAEVTRMQAEQEDADQRTPAGSHDMPARGAHDDDHILQHQQGTGQSDDITGKAPASGMARQKANPARR